jgi:hypothetical protein
VKIIFSNNILHHGVSQVSLSNGLLPSGFPNKTLCACLITHACYMPCLCHWSPWFWLNDDPDHTTPYPIPQLSVCCTVRQRKTFNWKCWAARRKRKRKVAWYKIAMFAAVAEWRPNVASAVPTLRDRRNKLAVSRAMSVRVGDLSPRHTPVIPAVPFVGLLCLEHTKLTCNGEVVYVSCPKLHKAFRWYRVWEPAVKLCRLKITLGVEEGETTPRRRMSE